MEKGEPVMAELTRRRFLVQSWIGVAGAAAAGAGGVVLHELTAGRSPSAVLVTRTSDPLVLHVRDARKGEVALLVGTSEVVYKEPELVQRILSTAHQAIAAARKSR